MPEPKHFPAFKASLPSMQGKTVVITGTTSGTGNVAAHAMADLGATVVVLNRASTRAAESFAELSAAFPDAELHNVECDLQSFASVKGAAEQLRGLCPKGIDVLANNAGVMTLPDRATGDGFDVQMQTNHLSHFLLTKELLPLLELAADAAGESRIVNHSSIARLNPSKELLANHLEANGGNLGGDGSALQNAMYRGPRWLRYNQSKLANAAFTAALHNKLSDRGSSVKALVAHPGVAKTQLTSNAAAQGGIPNVLTGAVAWMFQSPEDGAMGLLSCMCLPEATSGQFWGPGRGARAMKGKAAPFGLEPFYDNDATRELLWIKSEEAIGARFAIE